MTTTFGPVIGMIHNTTAGTYHPVLFIEDPLPGPLDQPGRPARYKSKFHHTKGFASRDEADKEAIEILAPRVATEFGSPRIELGKEFAWDGEGIPAMVTFFDPS